VTGKDETVLGFIGLGAIGGVLATALRTEGYELVVFDTRADAAEPLMSAGAERANSPAGVADRAQVVFTSLPTPEVLRNVALGPGGLIHGKEIRILVDLSTVGSATAHTVAARLHGVGIGYVDAPVSGGVAGARGRRLTAMVSGDERHIATIEPLLALFAAQVFRVGADPGQAQLVKLLNNLLSATALLITSEATTLAVRAGLDPAILLEVINASTGRNTATAEKFPTHVLTRRFGAEFRLGLMAKDVDLCLGEAQQREVSMLLGGRVHQLWAMAAARSPEDADVTEIVRMYEESAQVVVEQQETRIARR
jgi:3-hydroxyisobutyrate dehydrogenase-like beta-hydroxyacid dehydrogenase